MVPLLIDDSGNVRDSTSPALRAELKAWHLGPKFSDYVIRNLGFVALSADRQSVRVRLRPAVTSPVAFAALLDWLADRAPERVAISYLGDHWNHEFFASADAARKRLVMLVATWSLPDRDGAHPFVTLLKLRDEAQETLKRAALETVLEDKLRNRVPAIADRPKTSRTRDRDTRLLLPMRPANDRQRLSSATLSDAGIDLSPKIQ